MNEISSVSRSSLPAYKVGSASQAPANGSAGHARGSDQAEFSVAARLLSRLDELPDVRGDLVARVKAEIEAGTYETDDKLELAINELAEDLG